MTVLPCLGSWSGPTLLITSPVRLVALAKASTSRPQYPPPHPPPPHNHFPHPHPRIPTLPSLQRSAERRRSPPPPLVYGFFFSLTSQRSRRRSLVLTLQLPKLFSPRLPLFSYKRARGRRGERTSCNTHFPSSPSSRNTPVCLRRHPFIVGEDVTSVMSSFPELSTPRRETGGRCVVYRQQLA